MGRALRVGLTGGIGSGKSAAAEEFARLGATVIDTDLIARELVEPGQPALAEIVDTFGTDILDASGALRRERLRERAFSNPEERRALEKILHPKIRRIAIERSTSCPAGYCVLVIPLLAESAQDYPLDRVLVIDCPEALQRERVARRDRLSADEIDTVLASQASRSQRLSLADDIIVNNSDLAHLNSEIQQLHHRYLALSA